MGLAFIPSISCRSTWKSFMSTMENMNKLSGMQTDMLFIEKGILWLPVWKVSSLWRGGEWLYIQDLEELWTDCQWYPSLASPHPAFENVRGRMLQKLLQPFVVLLEKKKEGPLLSPLTLLWQSKGEKYKKNKPKKIVETTKTVKTETKTRGEKNQQTAHRELKHTDN